MKFFVACLIGLALSGAIKIEASPVESSSELDDIFDEFSSLVPGKKNAILFITYLSYVPEFQERIEYYQSDEFKELLKKVESIEDVINFIDYVEESGYPMRNALRSFHEMIGLEHPVTGRTARATKSIIGVASYHRALLYFLPSYKIKALHEEKLKTSPAFARFVERIRAPKFQELIDAVAANDEFQEINKIFHEHYVDIKASMKYHAAVLGLEDVL